MDGLERRGRLLARAEGAVMLGIPAVAVAVAAAVLLGPGQARPAIYARAYGAASGSRISLRVLTSTSAFGVDEPKALRDFEIVERRGGSDIERYRGTSGEDGVSEATFDAEDASRTSLDLKILWGAHRLAAGAVPRPPREAAATREAWVEGPTRGALRVSVLSATGYLAAPFEGGLVVAVDEDERPISGADVELDAPGADLEPTRVVTDESGRAHLRVTPHAHLVELSADATLDGKSGHFEGHLPIVPGAMTITDRTVLAPSPRPRAYLSFWRAGARVFGQVVPLAQSADGLSFGSLNDEAMARILDGDWVTLSSDALEDSSGTLTRVPGGRLASPPKLELLLDGRAEALQDEERRAWRARSSGLGVVIAAALAEVLVILARGHRAQARLEAHLAREGEGEADALAAARTPSAYWAFASVAIIVFAFGVLAGVAALR